MILPPPRPTHFDDLPILEVWRQERIRKGITAKVLPFASPRSRDSQ